MIVKEIKYKQYSFTGFEIEMPHAPLILVKAKNGYVMCGYLDITAAEKLGDCAAIVRGVKSIKELIKKEVTDVTPAAKLKNVKIGITGLQALIKMAK
ncbi:MAG: DUF1805 domain-containing protein [bacterium]